jgi:type VI secretion system protein ImpH
LTQSGAFSFFQAIRLLRHFTKSQASARDAEAGGTIRVRPNLSLAFPASDIEEIEPSDDGSHFRVTANFLGIYGCASPLPTFYTEDLLDEAAQDESVSREFIDIFNQRLYDLLYEGWLKYRQFLNIVETKDSQYLERLYCLLGLGAEPLRHSQSVPGGDYRLLRYIGLFTQYPRSAEGLGALLRDALDEKTLTIVPCVLRKANIPASQQLRLGQSGGRLGVETYLGEEIADRMGKFRIQIGPLDQKGFLKFTPGKESYHMLVALTQGYLADPLSYEVELILGAAQAQTAALGDPVRAVLGVTTWVFSTPHLGEVRTRFTVQRS